MEIIYVKKPEDLQGGINYLEPLFSVCRPSLASDETKGELARLCLATTVERVMPMMSGSMKVACGAVTSTGASVGAACGGRCAILNFDTRWR